MHLAYLRTTPDAHNYWVRPQDFGDMASRDRLTIFLGWIGL